MLYTSVLAMLGAQVGIQKKALHQLAQQVSVTLKELTCSLSLTVPAQPDDELLNYLTSAHVIKTAELSQKGFEVFGEEMFSMLFLTI